MKQNLYGWWIRQIEKKLVNSIANYWVNKTAGSGAYANRGKCSGRSD